MQILDLSEMTKLWVEINDPTECQRRYKHLKYDVNTNICDKPTKELQTSSSNNICKVISYYIIWNDILF